MGLALSTCLFPLGTVIHHYPEWRCVTLRMCVFGGGGVKSHSGACEDKQSQSEENDTNQLKHYCPPLLTAN